MESWLIRFIKTNSSAKTNMLLFLCAFRKMWQFLQFQTADLDRSVYRNLPSLILRIAESKKLRNLICARQLFWDDIIKPLQLQLSMLKKHTAIPLLTHWHTASWDEPIRNRRPSRHCGRSHWGLEPIPTRGGRYWVGLTNQPIDHSHGTKKDGEKVCSLDDFNQSLSVN